MDLYVVILRNLHIFGGIIWVGFALVVVLALIPAVKNSNAQGHAMMRSLLTNSRFGMIFPISSIVTVVAGLLLYYNVSDGFNSDYMSSSQGIVLSIGVLFGLLAFGHGAAATGRATSKYAEALQKDGPEAQSTAAAFDKLVLHSYISTAMTVIAVVAMASARYVG